MTLVITAATPRHIVQASDRRVILRHTSGREDQRDGHVKAVITQCFCCSYTGLAGLGDADTADWLATHLSDHAGPPDCGISTIAAAAEAEVVRCGLSNGVLTIVCAGWVLREGHMTPVLKCVSNVNPGGVGPRFTLIGQDVVEGRRSAVHAVGQDLTAGEFAGVNRAVEKLCATGRDTARAIAQVLTETIRAVAKSADRRAYVSDDVLVTSLPRPDLLRDQLVVGKLVEDYWSVTNIPGGDSRKERHGGPVIVGHKAAVQALPPEDGPPIGALGTFSGVRLVRVPESDRSLVMYVLTDPPLGAAWGWPG